MINFFYDNRIELLASTLAGKEVVIFFNLHNEIKYYLYKFYDIFFNMMRLQTKKLQLGYIQIYFLHKHNSLNYKIWKE